MLQLAAMKSFSSVHWNQTSLDVQIFSTFPHNFLCRMLCHGCLRSQPESGRDYVYEWRWGGRRVPCVGGEERSGNERTSRHPWVGLYRRSPPHEAARPLRESSTRRCDCACLSGRTKININNRRGRNERHIAGTNRRCKQNVCDQVV